VCAYTQLPLRMRSILGRPPCSGGASTGSRNDLSDTEYRSKETFRSKHQRAYVKTTLETKSGTEQQRKSSSPVPPVRRTALFFAVDRSIVARNRKIRISDMWQRFGVSRLTLFYMVRQQHVVSNTLATIVWRLTSVKRLNYRTRTESRYARIFLQNVGNVIAPFSIFYLF